jgi:hypothetical protein
MLVRLWIEFQDPARGEVFLRPATQEDLALLNSGRPATLEDFALLVSRGPGAPSQSPAGHLEATGLGLRELSQ